tara:strand:+ start:868 stop:1083 length:216 start_codon:yes stop_codon:yes gene_type:complete
MILIGYAKAFILLVKSIKGLWAWTTKATLKHREEKVNAQYIKDNEALERKLRDARNNRLRKSKTKSIKKRP